jgi:hypothetical protein
MRRFELSFQAKRVWAHKRMNALRKDIIMFGASKPCVIVHDFDDKRLKHVWRVNGEVNLPPQSISLRLGEVLYNFRGALDHLACALVSPGHSTEFTAFPLCDGDNGEKRFNSDYVQRQLAGIEGPLVAIIKKLQPYNRTGSHSTNHLLGLLNSLGNIEKHREFNLIAASVDLATFSIDESLLTKCSVYQGPIKNGTILAVAEGQVDVDFKASFGVAFGQGRKAAGELVDVIILRIEDAVEDVMRELAGFALKRHTSSESGIVLN